MKSPCVKSRLLSVASLWLSCVLSHSTFAANITPYYLTDGDRQIVYEISNGVVTNSFTTFSAGYPIAVRDTIWLGSLQDTEAREYTLNGTATGGRSLGSNNFSQVLDGATGPDGNYGVECCGDTNSVSFASKDWSSQGLLFDLDISAGNLRGNGIAYDLSENTFFVAGAENIFQYDIAGNLINILSPGQSLAALAYELATDTIWGFNRSTSNIVQLDRTGNVLQDVNIPGFEPFNVWGGEMSATTVPVPASLWLFGSGLIGLVGIARKK